MIAGQIQGVLRRSGDLCARADEYSIVALTHGQRLDEIRALALRLAANVCDLAMHNPRGRHGRYISAQIGVAGGIPDGDYTPEVAIAEAREDLMSQEPIQTERFKACI
jgi:PleD family two-component response regulator